MKSIFLLILSFIMAFAILAPPIISLLNDEGNTVLTINLNEEEQQEQGTKNQGEEKIIKENLIDFTLLAAIIKAKTGGFYIMFHTDHTVEILLPPPESLG